MIDGIKTIEFADWANIDLRVAEVLEVEDIEGADKLYKITLDVGEEIGKRTVCAGIKEYYSKKDLKKKKIIYFFNLKPRLMKGIVSEGMLLAASNKDHSKVILIAPEKDIENGSRIS
jgi:methionine--tRNA ligase beta chain